MFVVRNHRKKKGKNRGFDAMEGKFEESKRDYDENVFQNSCVLKENSF